MFIRLATDLAKFRHFGEIFKYFVLYESLFSVWRNIDSTSTNLLMILGGIIFVVRKWLNIKQII